MPVAAAPGEPLPALPAASPDRYSAGVARDPAEVPDQGEPTLTPSDRALHDRARESARAGRYFEAKTLLGRLAVAYPESDVLVAQYNAVVARMDAAQAEAKAELEAAPPTALPAPPASYTLAREASVPDPVVPKLVKASERKNEITDEAGWFDKNGLSLPIYYVPPRGHVFFAPGAVRTRTVVDTLRGFAFSEYEPAARFLKTPLPLEIPLRYGTASLQHAIDSGAYRIAVYGDEVVAVFDAATRRRVALFDLTAFAHPPADKPGTVKVGEATLTTPEGTQRADLVRRTHTVTHDVRFALADAGVLYIAHGNLSSAKDNQGQNGYVSAIDLASKQLLWRSAPLVANAGSFALVRGALVTGYGFTAEPDFVYVLERKTGKVAQKIPVRTGPEEFVLKDGRLFVRTYDTDLVFDAR